MIRRHHYYELSKTVTKITLGPNRWYTAVRVPDADESNRFKNDILAGVKVQKHLRALEQKSLTAIRAYAAGILQVDAALEPIVTYGEEMGKKVPIFAYRDTLNARPWESCNCRVCREVGVEVIIFRGSNRNRRRGFHNLWAFHQQLKKLRTHQDSTSELTLI